MKDLVLRELTVAEVLRLQLMLQRKETVLARIQGEIDTYLARLGAGLGDEVRFRPDGTGVLVRTVADPAPAPATDRTPIP